MNINWNHHGTEFKEKLNDAICRTVSELAEYYTDNGAQRIKLTVNEYLPSGKLCGISTFAIDADDLLDHVKKAKKRTDCTVDVSDTTVTITRTWENGGKYVAVYVPVAA